MGSSKHQYLATLCVNLLTMGYGAVCGWPSASTLLLMSDESPLPTGKITMEAASWITAMICVGGFIGNFVFAWITERYGRKIPLLLAAVPQIISWYLITIATDVSHLYIARFLAGFSGGGVFVVVPSFIAEIAEDRIRGTLGSTLVLSCNTGILLIFLLGNYATYEFAPKVLIGILTLFLCTFTFLPESPQYLLKKNREFEAEKSLRFYRGIVGNVSNYESELLRIELNKLKIVYNEEDKSNDNKKKLTIDDFKSRESKKSLLIAFVLVALNQLCGCFAMLNYTATIFAEAGSDLAPNMSAIVIGFIQLFGSYISVIMVDRAGRKFLIVLSAIGISLGQVCLGIYAMVKADGYDVSSYGWIPLACFSFVICIASIGVLTLPFLVIAEIIPEKIRNFGVSFSMSILWVFAFIMLKMFPVISNVLGMDGSMFLYASVSLSGALFIMFFMPETKGRSFEEIVELLRK